MKANNEIKKINGIKKACSEINNNKNLNRSIMYNARTGEVFVDCFADENSWNEYHDSDIVRISKIREGMWNNYVHTSMAQIKVLINCHVTYEIA